MPKRKVFVLQKKESPWVGFLQDYFEETPTELRFFHEPNEANQAFERPFPDLAFVDPELLAPPFAQKLRAFRQSTPPFRIFRLGKEIPMRDGFGFDGGFDEAPLLWNFQKELVNWLPFPERIRVLVVDDEKEIGDMIRDYLDGRRQPAFEVRYAENGQKGLEVIEKDPPDVLVLDIKMPVRDGREVYRELAQKKVPVPVIIFFDAISGDEMLEIHKYGRPAVVDKAARESNMPGMLALIKKMAYFG